MLILVIKFNCGFLGLAKYKATPKVLVGYLESVELLSVDIFKYIAHKKFAVLILNSAACGTAKNPSLVMYAAHDAPAHL